MPSPHGNRQTLDEVARVAGVSARTVSRAVNNEYGIAPRTRERIMEIVRDLGYRPNMAARSLVTQRSSTIGLMLTHITDPFFPDLADAVDRRVVDSGRSTFLALNYDDRARQSAVVDTLIAHGVDGLIAVPARDDLRALREAADLGIPVVVTCAADGQPRMSEVTFDLHGAGVLAAAHLVERGHTGVGMVSHARPDPTSAPRRERGYLHELRRHGLEARVMRGQPTIDGGARATRRLLEEHPEVTAVFAYNDLMAVGALHAAKELGRGVPDDLAVCGCNDIVLTTSTAPPLTTIRLDRERAGTLAVEVLSEMLVDPTTEPRREVVPTSLVVRAST